MGKISKKMGKKIAQEGKAQRFQELRATMQRKIEEEEYGEALTALAELIKNQCFEPELMYQGAYCYFMLGDYTRAAEWINNTMRYAPAHIAARILLARICVLEDRTDDGLAILDFVLEHDLTRLSDEQREEIEDILEYYGRNEEQQLRDKFPYAARFLKLDGKAGQSVMPAVEQPELETVHKEKDAELQQILDKDVSVREKISLLNAFAGAYFYQEQWQRAEVFLSEARRLDVHADETLRNSAVLSNAMGDKEAALQYAAKMSVTDFVLLSVLR